jgi:hypothetical protein
MKGPHADKGRFLALPGVIFSVFPAMVCPGCWPAYSGLLAAVGLPFFPTSSYLLPMTVVFLLVAVAALGFRADERRGYWPFLLGVAASMVILVSRFVVDVRPGTYAGAGLLIAASIWNSAPRRTAVSLSCTHCARPDHEATTKSVKEVSL